MTSSTLPSISPGATSQHIAEVHIHTPVFTSAPFTTAKRWDQTRCPATKERIKKGWFIYTTDFLSYEK